MRQLADHLTYANVMSTVAAFIALGGVSYAAVTLPKNSVGNAQLKKNAVTSAKIKNGTIQRADLAKGLLPVGAGGIAGAAGPKGDTGAAGIKGDTGAAGPKGETGAIGLAGPAGPAGEVGAIGPTGAVGVTGVQGTVGSTGTRGATGATGVTGLSTGAAGGSLSGNYPNPSLADGSVTTAKIGANAITSAKVGADALTGDDIDESTLEGVALGDYSTHAFDIAQGNTASIVVPGTVVPGTLFIGCSGSSTSTSLTWTWSRSASAPSFQDVQATYAPAVGDPVGDAGGRVSSGSSQQSFTQASSTVSNQPRSFRLRILSASADSVAFDAHAVTRDGGGTGCLVQVRAERQDSSFVAVP